LALVFSVKSNFNTLTVKENTDIIINIKYFNKQEV